MAVPATAAAGVADADTGVTAAAGLTSAVGVADGLDVAVAVSMNAGEAAGVAVALLTAVFAAEGPDADVAVPVTALVGVADGLGAGIAVELTTVVTVGAVVAVALVAAVGVTDGWSVGVEVLATGDDGAGDGEADSCERRSMNPLSAPGCRGDTGPGWGVDSLSAPGAERGETGGATSMVGTSGTSAGASVGRATGACARGWAAEEGAHCPAAGSLGAAGWFGVEVASLLGTTRAIVTRAGVVAMTF